MKCLLSVLLFCGIAVSSMPVVSALANDEAAKPESKPESEAAPQSALQSESEPEETKPEPKPVVWFVHGMITVVNDSFDKELEALRKTFPEAESVTLKKWNSPKMPIHKMATAWNISLENSEKFALQLADEIQTLSVEQRDRLVLVGHSLGARIAVRTLARCAERGVKIRQLILAGAAIDNDDPDIAKAITASKQTVYNVVNPNDSLLLLYKVGGEQRSALGTGYLYVQPADRFCEVLFQGSVYHYCYMYLQRFQECVEKNDFHCPIVIVPQDYTNADFPTLGGYFWWYEIDSQDGWRLQQNALFGHCRILDASGTRRAWGRLKNLRAAFEKVKVQLKALKETPEQKSK